MLCELGWAHEDPKFDHPREFTIMQNVLTEKTPRAYKFLTFFETRNKNRKERGQLEARKSRERIAQLEKVVNRTRSYP